MKIESIDPKDYPGTKLKTGWLLFEEIYSTMKEKLPNLKSVIHYLKNQNDDADVPLNYT